jgi:hypothetical protein
MPFLVVQNEPANPIRISLLGANTEMFAADHVADLIQQLFALVRNRTQPYNRCHESVFIRAFPRTQAD